MRRVTILFFLVIGAGLVFGQNQKDTKEFSNYSEMREYFGNLYQQKKYSEAAKILENHIDRFPDHLEANAYNLALTYIQLGEHEKGIDVLQYALDRGVWFSIYAFEHEAWTVDMEVTKKEITDAYYKIIDKYPIDKKEIIIGGFSAGGVVALEIAFSNSLPVTGFVVLCPGKPESFNEANIMEAKNRGIRGTILTSEMDPRLSAQEEMVEVFKTAGFQCQFIVTPDIGHWFPDDLDIKIDNAIDHIRCR